VRVRACRRGEGRGDAWTRVRKPTNLTSHNKTQGKATTHDAHTSTINTSTPHCPLSPCHACPRPAPRPRPNHKRKPSTRTQTRHKNTNTTPHTPMNPAPIPDATQRTAWQNLRQTGRISLESVAENIITCFSCGVARKISWMSRRMSGRWYDKGLLRGGWGGCLMSGQEGGVAVGGWVCVG
jgi:hypothetical protein